MTKQTAPIKRGMVLGGFLCPIPSKTPLGLTQQHPYGPYSTLSGGHNPIFAKVMGCPSGHLVLLKIPGLMWTLY